MQKKSKPNFFGKQFLILIIASLFFTFVVAFVPMVKLVDRAIVISMGIDYSDNNYNISLEIVMPEGGEGNSQTKSFSVVEGKGKSILESLNEIEKNIGIKVCLGQCNIIIFGKNMISQHVIPAINNIIEKGLLPEHAYIIATDNPTELQKTLTVTISNPGFELQKTLYRNQTNMNCVVCTVKKFIKDYMSESKTVFITDVERIKVQSDNIGDVSSYTPNKADLYKYDYCQSIVIDHEKSVQLGCDNSNALSVFLTQVNKGIMNIDFNGNLYSIEITGKKVKSKIDKDNNTDNYEFDIKGRLVEIENFNENLNYERITNEELKKMGEKFSEQLSEKLYSFIDYIKENKIDVLGLRNKLYQKYGKNIKEDEIYKDPFNLTFKIDVKIKVDKT